MPTNIRKHPVPLRRVLAAASACLFLSCITDEKSAPNGTEVENEITGFLYLADGRPAANATVKIFPVNYIAQPGAVPKAGKAQADVRVSVTDAKGKYTVDSLASGEYNILAKLGASQSYQDSVPVSSKSDELPPDTLEAAGTLAARVALEPNHDTRTVTVQLLGTDVFVNVDASGAFVLASLAEGTYRARITTTLPEYTPLFANLNVRAGAVDTLTEPLRPDYTGIPVVRGLQSRYDTLSGTATLSWQPAAYANLQHYAVFRDLKGATELSRNPMAFVTDTVYHDSLFRGGGSGGRALGGTQWVQYEYRVRVVNTSDIMGLAFGKALITMVPPAMATTLVKIRAEGVKDGRLSVNDTLRLIAGFANPTRKAVEIRWYLDPSQDPMAIASLDSSAGADTLVYRAPPFGRALRFRARVRDEAGKIWQDSLDVETVWDNPVASVGPDAFVSVGDTVRLPGSGTDGFGRIVKWEWDFGNTGHFSESSTRDTFLVAPAEAGSITVVFRVTDDDGRSATDVKYVHFMKEAPIADAGRDTVIAYPDSLRLRGGGRSRFSAIVKWEWDIGNSGVFKRTSGPDTTAPPHGMPASRFKSVLRVTDEDGLVATDTVIHALRPSRFRTPMPTARWNAGMAAVDGKLYVFGGRAVTNAGGQIFSAAVESYDTATHAWISKKPMEEGWTDFEACVSGGKIYLAGGRKLSAATNQVMEYDPLADTWRQMASLSTPRTDFAMVALNGLVYVIGGNEPIVPPVNFPSTRPIENLEVLDPSTNTWTKKEPLHGTRPGLAAAALNGKIYVTGGISPTNLNLAVARMDEYDPATDAWTDMANGLSRRINHSMVVVGGKILLLGGESVPAFADNTINEVESFDPATGLWKAEQPMGSKYYGASIAAIGDRIFSVGGSGFQLSTSVNADTEEYWAIEE